jgi:transcriptional activator SPT8
LSSWWENEEQSGKEKMKQKKGGEGGNIECVLEDVPGEHKLSAIYSLALHSEALWALQGCENGSINLVTVRHDEGRCHHVLRKQTGPISVLKITPDEKGALSGSWDRSVLEWDLQTGSVVRSYESHNSQLSSAEYQPVDGWDTKDPNSLLTTSVDGQCFIWDKREREPRKLPLSAHSPPWCLSVRIPTCLRVCSRFIGLLECGRQKDLYGKKEWDCG